MADADLNARVKEALERTEIMALSTIGPDGSWTSPVQFRYNEKLELSFVSMSDTKHAQNILEDPRVSVAIYSFPGPEGGNLGLQIKGKANDVTGQSGTDEAVASSETWLRFRIVPEEVWCFDSRVFGGKRQRVNLSDLRLG
jgi:general stress protein 26